MIDLSTRHGELEIMGHAHFTEGLCKQTLNQLKTIKEWTRAYYPTIKMLQSFYKMKQPQALLHIIDVGWGRGDTSGVLFKVARKLYLNIEIHSINLNPDAIKEANERSNPYKKNSKQQINLPNALRII